MKEKKIFRERKIFRDTSLSLHRFLFDLLIVFFLEHMKITTIKIKMNAHPDTNVNYAI